MVRPPDAGPHTLANLLRGTQERKQGRGAAAGPAASTQGSHEDEQNGRETHEQKVLVVALQRIGRWCASAGIQVTRKLSTHGSWGLGV